MKRFFHILLLSLVLLGSPACGTLYQGGGRLSQTSVESLKEKILSYGESHPDGFTLDIRTFSEADNGISVACQLRRDRQSLEDVISHAYRNGGYVGGWWDSVNGRYVYDSVRLFPEDQLDEAMEFGRRNRQDAIYIISSGTEIRLVPEGMTLQYQY